MRGKAQRDGRPAVKWMETYTLDCMGKVWMWYLIQASSTETAVQARDNPWVTSANHCSQIISVLPLPVAQETDGD